MNSKTLAHDRLKRMCGSSSFTKTKVRHHAKARAETRTTSSHHANASTPQDPPDRPEVNVREELVRQVDLIIASEAHVIESALQLCQKIDLAIAACPTVSHS